MNKTIIVDCIEKEAQTKSKQESIDFIKMRPHCIYFIGEF